jgi:hypothetical protein
MKLTADVNEVTSLRWTRSQKEQVQELARSNDRTLTAQLRHIVREHLARQSGSDK